jgi:hypothetical protein
MSHALTINGTIGQTGFEGLLEKRKAPPKTPRTARRAQPRKAAAQTAAKNAAKNAEDFALATALTGGEPLRGPGALFIRLHPCRMIARAKGFSGPADSLSALCPAAPRPLTPRDGFANPMDGVAQTKLKCLLVA